ncbi:MAG: glycosyltransferase family 4 protein [Acidobacteriota bacterium]|nr:glycosyltransferase family 4 protein [Blastocatellia bacterium]MDW8238435.1 glycosyltransferase family 4 protein [Acidobacteriota bacterium]
MASAGNKVLIIVHNLPVPFDRRVWLEANALREAGYEVSIICPQGEPNANFGKRYGSYDCLNGIHIYRYKAPTQADGLLGYVVEFAYGWLMTLLLSLKVWYKHGFDIIQACNPPDTYWLLARFYKLWGKRFIFDHHDLCPELYLAKYRNRQPDRLYRWLLFLERQTFRTADVVIATNESYRRIALLRGQVPPDRVFIVRNGPDFDRLRPLPPEPALKQGRRHLICYLGMLCNHDGVDYLIRAMHHMVYQVGYRDVLCAIIGSGPEFNQLKALSEQLGLSDYVLFTGRLSDHDVCRYLSTADVCVDPLPRNAFSDKSTMNKIGEYMAFGKPIVAFDLTETRATAQDAALYAKPNEEADFVQCLLELLRDERKREQMGRSGRRRVETQLLWSHSVPQLLAAYRLASRRDQPISYEPEPSSVNQPQLRMASVEVNRARSGRP